MHSLNPLRHAVPWVLLMAATTIVLAGCSIGEQIETLSAEERLARGKALFDEEDYLEAINEFTVVTLQFQGSAVAGDAQYYLGECRFRREEYLLAAFEYQQLLRNMPASPLVPDAQFRIGMCYYHLSPKARLDQQYTLKAIDELQAFVEYHPGHEKAPEAEARIRELTTRLAQKSFEIGRQYVILRAYRSAQFYFDDVIEKYHDTEYAPPAYLEKAEVLIARRKFEEASATITLFLERFPANTLREQALRLRETAERELARARKPALGSSTP